MPGFDLDSRGSILFCNNVDFSGSSSTSGTSQVTADGQLLIGSSVSPYIRVGTLGSSDSSITWTVGNGTITGQVAGGTTVGKTITGNTGGAISPTAGNWTIQGNGSLTSAGSGSTLAFSLTGLTNHAVLVGSGGATITKVGPTSTSGQILQSAGASADPAFSTATYPATTTVSQLLYSSSANTVAGLATANSAVLTTNSTGVPVWSGSMTNGQLIIGNTSGTPTAGTITAGPGILVTNSAGTITIAATGTGVSVPGVENIGIAYSAGTFSVLGADGATSLATTPGYVTMQSGVTPGKLVTVTVSANQTFTDGSGGVFATQRFGLVAADVWGSNDIPFFLYSVIKSDDSAVAFMISRNPSAKVAPAAASIGKSGALVNVGQGDFYSLLTGITTSQYAGMPALYLGCFRMQFTGATNSWTVTALGTGVDGIGLNFNNTPFTFPKAVQGAAANTHFLANGGTAPVYTNDQMTYVAHQDGLVDIYFDLSTNTTAGVGAVSLILSLPYTNPSLNQNQKGFCMLVATGTNTYNFLGMVSNTTAQPQVLFWQNAVIGYTVNTVFGANTKANVQLTYKAF